MFKNFTELNSKLANTAKNSKYFGLQRLLDAVSTILTTLGNLSSGYSEAYSQVQWMKYSSDGDPTDVTPTEQDSAASAVIVAAKQNVSNAMNTLSEVSPLTVSAQVSLATIKGCAGTGNKEFLLTPIYVNEQLLFQLEVGVISSRNDILISSFVKMDQPVTITSGADSFTMGAGRFAFGYMSSPDGIVFPYCTYPNADGQWMDMFYIFDGKLYLANWQKTSEGGQIGRVDDPIIIPSNLYQYISCNTPFPAAALFMIWRHELAHAPTSGFTVSGNPTSLIAPQITLAMGPLTLSGNISAQMDVDMDSICPGISDAIHTLQQM